MDQQGLFILVKARHLREDGKPRSARSDWIWIEDNYTTRGISPIGGKISYFIIPYFQ